MDTDRIDDEANVDPTTDDVTAAEGGGRRTGIRIGAVVAAVLVVVALLWAWSPWSSGSGDQGATPTESSSLSPVPAVVVDEARLAALPAEVGHPVYWLGARDGFTYELSSSTNASIIRYLPAGAEQVGPAEALAVGSYLVDDAYRQVEEAATRKGGQSMEVGSDGLAVTNSATALNAYLAYKGGTVLVEVFDPVPGAAWEAVTSGQVQPTDG